VDSFDFFSEKYCINIKVTVKETAREIQTGRYGVKNDCIYGFQRFCQRETKVGPDTFLRFCARESSLNVVFPR
jgi:hypothetical protein